MGKYKKDKQGYYVETFTFNGKRYKVRGRTREKLDVNKQNKMKELEEGYDRIYNPTLSQYHDYFIEIRRQSKQGSTIRRNIGLAKRLFEHRDSTGKQFGNVKIKELSRRDIERTRLEMINEGIKPEYLNDIFAYLNTMLISAMRDETIDKNPCQSLEKLKRESPKVDETLHRALTKEETRAFLATAKERNSFYYNAFLFMLVTGVRVGEMSALTPRDIDNKHGVIHINKTIQRIENNRYIVAETTKTATSKRDIQVKPSVISIIQAQRELNEMVFGAPSNIINMADNIEKQLIFKSLDNKILLAYTFNREIDRICKQAGIERFTSHSFRNTFATRWIEDRPQDYKVLSEILGHKDVSITLNLYAHVMQDKKIEAMISLEYEKWGIV